MPLRGVGEDLVELAEVEAGATDDDPLGGGEETGGVAPLGEGQEGVGAGDGEELGGPGEAGLELAEGVDGVVGAAVGLGRVDGGGLEARLAQAEEFGHLEAVGEGSGGAVGLERLAAGGRQEDAVEAEAVAGGAGDLQMSDVRRVEAAAEVAEAHRGSAAQAAVAPWYGSRTGAGWPRLTVSMRAFLRVLMGAAVMQGLVGSAQTADSGEAAFKAARAVAEPGTRVAALLAFVREHPESALIGRANRLALETDLAFFPERTDEIHGLATRDVNSERAGLDRWIEEAKVADMLASAGESGADLADAKVWAQQALAGMTEESFRREVTASQARFKLPPLGARQVHRDFVGYRAAFLAAMANVDLRLGQAEAAADRCWRRLTG